jgi:hypothetical protein
MSKLIKLERPIVIKDVRAHYVNLITPYQYQEGSDAKWAITGAFKKNHVENDEVIKNAVESLRKEAEYKKGYSFLRDGDESFEDPTGKVTPPPYPGMWAIKAKSGDVASDTPYFTVEMIKNGEYVTIPRSQWGVIKNGSLLTLLAQPYLYNISNKVGSACYLKRVIIHSQGEPFAGGSAFNSADLIKGATPKDSDIDLTSAQDSEIGELTEAQKAATEAVLAA